jgi:hypothetical protein
MQFGSWIPQHFLGKGRGMGKGRGSMLPWQTSFTLTLGAIMRPTPAEYNPYYHKYIERVPDEDIRSILRVQLDDTLALLRPVSEEIAAFRYAEAKWSIKQVVGHLIDVERIMTYRALRIARADQTPLPGFDENVYAQTAESDRRTLGSLLAELEATRAGTAAFFHNLPAASWERTGTANNAPISVRAVAYIIAGHELHHRELLQERYLAVAARA